MATKKATKKTKKATRKSTRRTTKKAKDESMDAVTEEASAAVIDEKPARAKRTRKKTATATSRKKTTAKGKSKDGIAEVEKSNDEIKIRFAPVAPPPFVSRASTNGDSSATETVVDEPRARSRRRDANEDAGRDEKPKSREAREERSERPRREERDERPRRADRDESERDDRDDRRGRGRRGRGNDRRARRRDEDNDRYNRDENERNERSDRDDNERGRRNRRDDEERGNRRNRRDDESDGRRNRRDDEDDNRGNRRSRRDDDEDRDSRRSTRRDRDNRDDDRNDDHEERGERGSRSRRSGRRRRGGRRSDFHEVDVAGPGAVDDEGIEREDVDAIDDEEEESVTLHAAPKPDPADDEFYRRRRGRRERTPREEVVLDDEEDDTDTKRKTMVINVVPRDECRIAVLAEGKLEEINIERASSENYVGNIYKGVVTNVEPSIQAAFIDFGIGKNGFLHISDLHPEYFGKGEKKENVGRKTPRRRRPPIQECLRKGQEVIVQITKEGIGTKGPTLTTYLSIPGRFVVMMPGMEQLGVSRKIEDETQRRKVRQKLNELELPKNIGFIARTAALGQSVEELQADVNYLTRLWKAVEKRRKNNRAPAEIYRESDLVIRTIRDAFTPNITSIVVDDESVAARAQEFLSIFRPDAAELISVYDKPKPIFHHYRIEDELERLHSRHVPLSSGGSLVIDQTEALVAIDVNSGKFRTEDDAETTAFKMNLEAADEIPRQLRLRDLGGVVICDFIDMRDPANRRSIERRLVRNLKAHKERAKILRMSSFGIIEMTRQRQRASLTKNVYQECNYCRGTGLVKTAESVALDVMRLIQLSVTRDQVLRVEAMVSLEVAALMLNRKRALLNELESEHQRTIIIHPEPRYGLDHVELRCTDNRGRLIPHD